MAEQQQQQQRSKQTSILLTFCILQFVRQLRRRVKPRVREGSIDTRSLGITLPGVSSAPSPSIKVQDAKQMRRAAHGVCKSQCQHHDNPALVRSSCHLHTPASAAPASRNLADDKVQQYVFGSFCLVSPTKVSPVGCCAQSTVNSMLRETLFQQLQVTAPSFSNTTMHPLLRGVP